MIPVAFLPAAVNDFEESYSWYAARSLQAAAGFLEAVETALRGIADAPGQWPVLDGRHRYRRLERFPYFIVYRVEDDRILVVAVAHGRRRPGFWRNRRS